MSPNRTNFAPAKSPLRGILTGPRIVVLLASLLVSLSSGTNYVYSAYAPQLGARLHINHTQLNIIGLAGNVGVYGTAPIWGRIVDRRGPRIPLTCAFVLLLTGYYGIHYFYDQGVPESATTISSWTFATLVVCGFLTGAGGNAGLAGAVNSTAKSFPDKARATATGLVIGGFGLSAFFFSSMARFAYPGDTSSFLLILALGTSCPMILGFFLVKAVPLPGEEHGATPRQPPNARLPHDPRLDSHTRLLDHVDGRGQNNDDDESDVEDMAVEYAHANDVDGSAVELSLSRGTSPRPDTRQHHRHTYPRIDQLNPLNGDHGNDHPHAHARNDGLPNIYGMKLARSPDFWLLFITLSIVSGIGLMYINNVGSMSQALFAHNNPNYDEKQAGKWQAEQVSHLSLMNFGGRIFIGVVSDFAKAQLGWPRSYCLFLVALFCFTSQVAASYIDNVEHLWIASSILGLAHGCAFSLFPTVCIEWFGLLHFSENWGYLSSSPVFAGNFFSMIFGKNLDEHAGLPGKPDAQPPSLFSRHVGAASTSAFASKMKRWLPFDTIENMVRRDARHLCLQGRQCYVDTLHLTITASIVAMGLSIYAAWRDRQKLMASQLKMATEGGEVVWENGEE
ncbi:MFS general substrate transporter [Pluteus cervinus]|uniref:MFS general substrate transporter n=1 Tax=Pluteus cervinus TaxID=181527 RepID=A0ACD3AFM8_9AGAR|nr:MFS general substrate transporter [Pluteus cervinus]